jgi:exosortase A-associated hydrolase 1
VNHTDQAVVFPCSGEALVGVLSMPERSCETAVVMIVGGPQYRAGSHRQFVLLARKLAAAGYAVLRFDYRGMGDSSGEQRNFESVSPDIAVAIDLVKQRVPHVRRVVLWGLCDGASAALLYCHATKDPRVTGLCLLNPWVRSEAGLARTQVKHYYVRRLMQRDFWSKLARGGVAGGAFADLLRNLRLSYHRPGLHGDNTSASNRFQHRMLIGWQAFEGEVILLLSGNDFTAREFIEQATTDAAWRTALADARGRLERHDLATADHTFSDSACRDVAESLTLAWLDHKFKDHPVRTAATRKSPLIGAKA